MHTSEKDFRASSSGAARRRARAPARLADERDSAKVLEEARTLLRVLDDALVASPTPYCCGSDADDADLTLYGMLERWLGTRSARHERRLDAHHRRRHGRRDGGVEAMRKTFGPTSTCTTSRTTRTSRSRSPEA